MLSCGYIRRGWEHLKLFYGSSPENQRVGLLPKKVMAEETKPSTQNETAETKVETKPKEENPETPDTLEEIQKDKPEKETVGLDKYLTEKNARKEAEKKAEALALEIETLKNTPGKSKAEIEEDIAELAKAHNIDEDFLQTLATSVYKKAKKDIEAELVPEVRKITSENKAEKVEKKFSELFEKTIADMPEYASIVNREVIKKLALDPANAKKRLPEILEETYGKAITGKKTIEAGPTGGKNEKIDFTKVTADDIARINADPTLKKEYSEWTQNQVKHYL